MALIRVNKMFKPFPSMKIYEQEVKLRPIEHHYENIGEIPYIKYGCQICEEIAKAYKLIYGEENFHKFSISKGEPNCPCCGIKLDWDYK